MSNFFILFLVSASCVSANRTLISNFVPTLSIETETSSPTVLAPLLVSTRFGLLRGMSLKTSNRHKTVSAFLGVPFAKPPGSFLQKSQNYFEQNFEYHTIYLIPAMLIQDFPSKSIFYFQYFKIIH